MVPPTISNEEVKKEREVATVNKSNKSVTGGTSRVQRFNEDWDAAMAKPQAAS